MLPYIWKVHDEVISVCFLGRLFNLSLRDVRPAVSDVLGDGGGEEDRLLAHDSDHFSQVADVKSADVVAIDTHLPADAARLIINACAFAHSDRIYNNLVVFGHF